MLRCKQIAEQASDYLDHQHSWQKRMAFRLHLMMCRNCRRYIDQLRSSIESLRLLKSRTQPILTEQQKQLAKQLRQQVQKR